MSARHLAELAVGDLSIDSPVRHSARRHLLDGIGTAVAARRRGAGDPGWVVAHALGGPPEATPLGGTDPLSAPAAAFANGVMVHALDLDDTHGGALVHPTSVTLPAALAVGQHQRATGRAVVDATAIGLEVACRLGAAVPHGFHGRGVHATAAVGPLSAAATTARLLGLPVDRVVDALGIAGSSSGGLLEFLDTGSDTKTLHPGTASMNGVLAARLAAAGASGPASVLEGRRGLFAALSDIAPDLDVVTRGLGEDWLATRIGIKPYPSCQLMHVALDAAAEALDGRTVPPQDVARIDVAIHPDSLAIVGDLRPGARPLSAYDAKFDVRWSLAALVCDGSVSLATYDAASIARPVVSDLAGRVELREQTHDGPAADAPGSVTLHLTDGSRFSAETRTSRGTVARPLSDDELVTKLVTGCDDDPRATELAERVLALDAETTIDPVLRMTAALSERT